MIQSQISEQATIGKRQIAVLLDPDKLSTNELLSLLEDCILYNVDYLFVGTSLMLNSEIENFIHTIKKYCDIPLLCFPGHPLQLHKAFDATLFISLISGRNPDYLIGHHVASAGMLKKWNQEVIPTGYMLIDGGNETSASYMSFTKPIPPSKVDIAVATALAGEYLGMRLIYMDAGSGAANPIPGNLIQGVKEALSVPLIVGGGLNSVEKVLNAYEYGADIVVVGNALEHPEKSVNLLKNIKPALDANHSDI